MFIDYSDLDEAAWPYYVSCGITNRLAVYADSANSAIQKALKAGYQPDCLKNSKFKVYQFDPSQVGARTNHTID